MSRSERIGNNENALLRQRLDALVGEARRNEHTLRRFQSLELRLMGCESLPELLHMLIYENRAAFGWDLITLVLCDPDFEIRRLLENSGDPHAQFPDLLFVPSEEELKAGYRIATKPMLGTYDPYAHKRLFRNPSPAPASVALLPLVRRGQLVGSFNLGSHDRERFRRQSATDFLQHLAAVISVCIETAGIRERLKHLGLTDPLTGVNNRRFFDQRLNEETARTQRTGSALSCLFIDIDHFKRINDTHGHQAGDEVLQEVARRIREQLRTIDVVARFGGEEFAVLLAHTANDRALEVAERIRGSIETKRFPLPGTETVTVSVGVATLKPEVMPADIPDCGGRLIEAADGALYQAKNTGRNRVVSAVR